MEGNNIERQSMRISPALGLLLVIIIALGAYFWLRSYHALAPTPVSTTPEASHIQVTQSPKVSGGTALTLPAGLPAAMPVETANVISSQVVNYKDHNVSASTVSYTSSKSVSTLWKMYTDYMQQNGFTLDPSKTSQAAGDMVGTKGATELSVTISTDNKTALVSLSLVTRQ